MSEHLLLFGASGAVGTAIRDMAIERDWKVTSVSHSVQSMTEWLVTRAYEYPYSAVCWAQGTNISDSVYDFDRNAHMGVYESNCVYVMSTLKTLLTQKLLSPSSRLCVISSIWQDISRPNKLSYSVSKAALRGLVLSAAADLAKDGHLINAVLPGAMDTPMTHAALTPEQITLLERETQFNRLPSLTDVASLVCYLCSKQNTGITGQFIAADLGYSHVRIV